MTSQPNPLSAGNATEWPTLIRTRANILVSGNGPRLESFWTACQHEFEQPVVRRQAGAFLELPRCRTLVLDGLEGLPAVEQHSLKRWLDEEENRETQIVSLTTAPLFEAVAQGTFDGCLFYRLNTIHLRLGSV